MRLAGTLRAAAGGGGWRERFECGGRDVARWAEGHEEEPAQRGRPAGGARRPHILPPGPAALALLRGGCDASAASSRYPGLSTWDTLRHQNIPSLPEPLGCLSRRHLHIPLSGRNPILKEVLGIRPHLLVLNKMDLADLTHKSHVVFTDCLTDENVKKLIPILTGLIKNSQRYQRAENVDNNIMVIGVPNVGKSSIINSLRKLHLRKGKAAPVGGAPGVTRAVLTKIQVSEKPLMYLLDTPGVLSPQIKSVETGLKLALYVERYGLSSPCDEVGSVLKSIAQHLGKVQKVQVLTGTGNVNISVPNYNAAACEFIYSFRKGLLGKVMLDQGSEVLE
ncbi:hypothetical protein E2320_004967 [Naja naja]|nr:hypothetical protein E2320_004967 [Naja naja]